MKWQMRHPERRKELHRLRRRSIEDVAYQQFREEKGA